MRNLPVTEAWRVPDSRRGDAWQLIRAQHAVVERTRLTGV
jgi:hypothetical protein